MLATMERPTDARQEWNHSCTSQCPNPCPASSGIALPEVDLPIIATGELS